VSNWNENLCKSKGGNFFQTPEYLNEYDGCFPVFVTVFDDSNQVIGQLGIRIIETTAMYSSNILKLMLERIKNITKRGIWVYAPIIHSNDKSIIVSVIKLMLDACDEICNKYDLVHIEGHTSPYDKNIDYECLDLFEEYGYEIQKNTTSILDLSDPMDLIKQRFSKNIKYDIKKAEEENINVCELSTDEQLSDYIRLNQHWAKSKGLTITDLDSEMIKIKNSQKSGIEKIFLGYSDGVLVSGVRLGSFNNILYTNFVINAYDESKYGGSLITYFYIQWAKNNGYRLLDLSGGSDDGNSLQFYKQKWGGKKHEFYVVVKANKKLSYLIYKVLFKIMLSYHKILRK
jgi:hypothetical protein